MLNSTTAYQSSLSSLGIVQAQALSDEIAKLELAIRNANARGAFTTFFNARVVGNPTVAVENTDGLTAMQIEFLNVLISAGYVVSRDTGSGWWSVSWSQEGPEDIVHLYTIRTILSPGSISAQTIDTINEFFLNHSPTATSRAVLFSPTGSGGNVDETTFGATASTFYEYSTLVTQQDALDYSADLKTALLAAGLGYLTGNVAVWRVM